MNAFPEVLTSKMVAGFEQLPTGSTHPHHGFIDGVHYVLKCGSYSTTSSDDHVHNECVADCLLRAAGCLVPESREYRADIGHGKVETVRLARFLEGGRHLKSAWLSADESIRRLLLDQIVATFPIQSFIGGIDTYQHPELDNVMVDSENRLWFIDNGASFDYRARGPRKYWFWDRADLMGRHGYYSLRYDKRVDVSTYDQSELRALLEGVSDESLRLAARKYDFPALVKTLPEDYQRPVLIDYAKKLQIWAKDGVAG